MSDALNPDLSFNFSKAQVLIIDQSPLSKDIATMILSGYGFRKIRRCSDISDGTDFLKTQVTDLVLIDPYCYGEFAPNLVSWLRADQKGFNAAAAVLFTTAHTPLSTVMAARNCGADYIVAKPFSTTALLDRVLWVTQSDARRGAASGVGVEHVSTTGSGMEMW
jgi:DNA-binding response OmpR family regulator